jgi:hypothetical protein
MPSLAANLKNLFEFVPMVFVEPGKHEEEFPNRVSFGLEPGIIQAAIQLGRVNPKRHLFG